MRKTVLAGMAVVAAACASHPAPTEQVATSLAAVRGAEEAGAPAVPEAALHMKLAEEQIEKAKELMGEDNARAEALAVRASQDAELAIALARESAARQRLQQFAQATPSAGGEQAPTMATPPAPTQSTNPGTTR